MMGTWLLSRLSRRLPRFSDETDHTMRLQSPGGRYWQARRLCFAYDLKDLIYNNINLKPLLFRDLTAAQGWYRSHPITHRRTLLRHGRRDGHWYWNRIDVRRQSAQCRYSFNWELCPISSAPGSSAQGVSAHLHIIQDDFGSQKTEHQPRLDYTA